MNFVDDPARRFVVAPLEGLPLNDGVALAASTVERAYLRVFRWTTGHGFQGAGLEQIVQRYRTSRSLLEALEAVNRHPEAAIFVLGIAKAEAESPSRLLEHVVQFVAQELEEQAEPGKRLILVVEGRPVLLEKFDGGRGRFEGRGQPSPPPRSEKRDTAAALSAQPEEGAPWEFADDPYWLHWIDSLNEGAISELTSKRLHQHSVRRLRKALSDVQGRFGNRNHALEMLVASAIARTNLVFLGPPGTAKSLMVRIFARALGVRPVSTPISKESEVIEGLLSGNRRPQPGRNLFEYLLTRYTTPEEIYGGADINVLLSTGMHARRTAGMLPQADIAFLDEIFKANSAILNTLLSLTNERLFYNIGQAFSVSLVFAVGAANETPNQEELGALFDRFPIRILCRPVPDSRDAVLNLIMQAHAFESAEKLGADVRIVPRSACLNDIRLLSKVVLGGFYGGTQAFEENNNKFRDHFIDMFLLLRREFGVSDRTSEQILRICRALALLEADGPPNSLSDRHLRAWGYVAPSSEAIADLQRLVETKIKSHEPHLVDLYDA